MEITNGEVRVDLPESLAKLLIDNRDWEKAGGRKRAAAPVEDDPIPMTHIPGVVSGVSMKKVRALVAAGAVPVTLDGRTKLLRPADVRAALAKENGQ